MIRKTFCEGFAAGLLGLGAISLSGAAELRGIHLSTGADSAQVTLDLTEGATHKLFTLEHPDRVVIDLSQTHLASEVRVPAASGAVTEVRIGTQPDGTLRVVVQLKSPLAAHSVWTPGEEGGQLVLNLGEPAQAVPKTVRAAHAPGEGERDVVIAVDAGHGGVDPGAIGHGGTREKDVTLAIARRLAALLEERLGAETLLTRTDDTTLSLSDRTARANSEGADLFVSIHANANPTGRLHGIETYYLDNAADHATSRLAAMENGLDLLRPRGEGSDLRYILSDLVQVGKMDESIALARAVQRAVVATTRSRYPYVTDLGVKRGPFYVLVGAYMPCVLVETSFLTHPMEGRRLARDEYQATLAEGIASGVARFLADARRARTL